MGIYLNPGNSGFQMIRNSTYVDKTGLIDFINSTINTPRRLTCFSRPRRFGKSFAAKTLCAYYDRSCDSRALFEGLNISGMKSCEKYRNQFNVIYIDITWFLSLTKEKKNLVSDIQTRVIRELRETFSGCVSEREDALQQALFDVSESTGIKFIIIIDEWDALFREAKDDDALQKEYIQLLRGLFKGGTATDDSIAAAYMTGILPVKKYGTESALTDFQEYTMTEPDAMAEYIGFTEDEVRALCEENHVDFTEMKSWYDGYSFEGFASVYNPNSVISAIWRKSFRSYWTKSETYESLKNYISMNFDGLRDSIIAMLSGQRADVDTDTFQNDMTSFESRDDVLTLLIHLGYLAYDQEDSEVYIPNREVADAFRTAVKTTDWQGVSRLLADSESLLKATLRGDAETVAAALELAHESNASLLKYNDENSLSCAITLAYYTARNYYEIIRELPSGKGFADMAFIPHRNTDKPAMVIELKYDKDADTAIRQIKDNRYTGCLKDFAGNLLLVGVNYDKDADGKEKKHHTCIIEKI
ncbi:MAG: ATP-binding protein [Lachnospiraceae bacterium]|nr:ATP-binding protein [Lachnospiraceae bacterium]